MTEVSAFLAFGAGLLSFLSPCVFPLIPSYLFFVGGMALRKEKSEKQSDGSEIPGIKGDDTAFRGKRVRGLTSFVNKINHRVFLRTLFFVFGFSFVFIAGGIILSTIIIVSSAKYIDIAAGIIIIVLGFNVMFDFFKFLNYEKRFHVKNKPEGFAGAFLIGAAFGAGWTPCVGPILGSILLMAGQSGSRPLAVLYLFLYSAGLGVPFLAAALFFDRFVQKAEKIKKYLPLIQKISGILLIMTGVLILSGRFQAVNIALQKWQFEYILWAEDKGPLARLFARWLAFLQGM